MAKNKRGPQRGSIIVGIIIGVVIGLGAALAVAVYVTKVPVPFMDKGATRNAEQDAAESRKNQNWDPNAPLYGKNPAKPAPAAPAAAVTPPPNGGAVIGPSRPADATAKPAPRAPAASADPLGELAAARSGNPSADPFIYFVQAGAFRTAQDAEAQRAKLSLMGLDAKVTEREQSGRQVYRVRVGPFNQKEEADRNKERLESSGVETALVRVQR